MANSILKMLWIMVTICLLIEYIKTDFVGENEYHQAEDDSANRIGGKNMIAMLKQQPGFVGQNKLNDKACFNATAAQQAAQNFQQRAQAFLQNLQNQIQNRTG